MIYDHFIQVPTLIFAQGAKMPTFLAALCTDPLTVDPLSENDILYRYASDPSSITISPVDFPLQR